MYGLLIVHKHVNYSQKLIFYLWIFIHVLTKISKKNFKIVGKGHTEKYASLVAPDFSKIKEFGKKNKQAKFWCIDLFIWNIWVRAYHCHPQQPIKSQNQSSDSSAESSVWLYKRSPSRRRLFFTKMQQIFNPWSHSKTPDVIYEVLVSCLLYVYILYVRCKISEWNKGVLLSLQTKKCEFQAMNFTNCAANFDFSFFFFINLNELILHIW